MKYNLGKVLKILISIIILLILGTIICKILSMNIGVEDIQDYVSSFGRLAPLVYIIM